MDVGLSNIIMKDGLLLGLNLVYNKEKEKE